MNRNRSQILAAVVIVAAVLCHRAAAQDVPPAAPSPDYKLLAAMSACADMACLDGYRQHVGDQKLAKIVYYEKWILLQHAKAAAEGLLRNLPQSELEQSQLMTLADWHEDATTPRQVTAALAEIYENWPRSIADAVLAFPQFLPAYIRYGVLARKDVHSDYTGNEERVCHADPAAFQAAFDRVDRRMQSELRKFVFNPEKCRAIFFSESN